MASWLRTACIAGLLSLAAELTGAEGGPAPDAAAASVRAPQAALTATPRGADSARFLAETALLPPPDDPAYSAVVGDLQVQWPVHMIGSLDGWGLFPGRYFAADDRPADAPIVAIIDTGIDPTHPDFVGAGGASTDVAAGGQLMLSAARTFLPDSPQGSAGAVDEHGRGTHLAGIVAAATNNGTTAGSGIAGIAYHARLLPIKVTNETGTSTHAAIAAAVRYAADAGALVIVIGLQGPTWSQALQDAVDYAWDRGCLLVAPAGDAGDGMPMFPGACPHVLAVAAVTSEGAIAGYSSRGDYVGLAAPGGDDAAPVYSTLPTYACTLRSDLGAVPYGWLYGTGVAAAHVAAAAALRAGADGIRPDGGRGNRALWRALQQTALRIGAAPVDWNHTQGYGMVRLPSLLAGQRRTAATGSITGRVLVSGIARPGAEVTAVPAAGGDPVRVETCWPAGAFRIANLPAGCYRVTAEADGSVGVWQDLVVEAGCDAPGVDFWLGDAPAGASLASASIPAAAVRGRSVQLRLTFANTGQSVWAKRAGYCLRQVPTQNALAPERVYVDLTPDEQIAPGSAREFSFTLPVPDACGFFDVGWQMHQEGGAGAFGPVAAATISVTSFLDVPADYWALDAIEAVKAAGIVSGYPGDLYYPQRVVSRDQMAVYISRGLAGGDGAVPDGPQTPTFPDVQPGSWAYKYIEYAHAAGIVQGYPDGLYHPGELIDRGQMAVFIARAMAGGEEGLASYVPASDPAFPDVPPDFWCYRYVQFARERGVTLGYPDGLYHPEYVCSRDQIAVYVARAFGLL